MSGLSVSIQSKFNFHMIVGWWVMVKRVSAPTLFAACLCAGHFIRSPFIIFTVYKSLTWHHLFTISNNNLKKSI